jgi:hypothetical protein
MNIYHLVKWKQTWERLQTIFTNTFLKKEMKKMKVPVGSSLKESMKE